MSLEAMGSETIVSRPMDRVEAAGLAELLKALGNPTRLRILSALDTACVPVGSIVAATGLRQPTVSHHLRILRDQGVVRAERRGPYVYYCAASDTLRPTIEKLRSLNEGRLGRAAVTSAIQT